MVIVIVIDRLMDGLTTTHDNTVFMFSNEHFASFYMGLGRNRSFENFTKIRLILGKSNKTGPTHKV